MTVISACTPLAPAGASIRGVLNAVDCRVEGVVQVGYASLLPPSGVLGTELTSLLIIVVALVGYSLMSGRGDTPLASLAATAIKIGTVVALTTHWGVYQILVYNSICHGPEQIASILLGHLRGAGILRSLNLVDQLQHAYETLMSAASKASQAASLPALPVAQPAAAASPQVGLISVQTFLGVAALTLLLGSLGVLILSKLLLGVLLCVGPLFIACALFEVSRGFFEGWLRAAVGVGLAPLFVTLALALTLSLLDPLLEPLNGTASVELDAAGMIALLCLVFASSALALALLAVHIASGFRMASLGSPRGLEAASGPSGAETPAVRRATPAISTRPAAIAASQVRRDTVDSRRRQSAQEMTMRIAEERRSVRRTPGQATIASLAVRSEQPSRRILTLGPRADGRRELGVDL